MKGCHCGICRPESGEGLRLALDSAAPDRLMKALRKRFRTPQDALRALGLDEGVLEEGEREMRLAQDARNRDMMRSGRDQEEMASEYDRRGRDWRSNRDQEQEGESEENERELKEMLAMLRDMSAEDRRMVADWMRSRTPTYDRRMMGRDQPPPFMGMPMPGGGMVGGSMNWSDERQARDYRKRREAEDGRRSRFAHDMAAHDDSFYRMFPDARRIGVTGF
jgi:hypothetical protein